MGIAMFLKHTKPVQFKLAPFQCQQGFNLIEVLITLVVLAVGLLGLAMLQNLGLRLGHQSYERTQATILIYDIVDRMRANPAGVTAGNYIIGLTDTPPSAGTDCGSVACTTPAAMAAYDLNQWLSNITGTATTPNPGITRPTLVGGQAEISRVGAVLAGGGAVYDVSIRWLEQRQGVDTSGTELTPEVMSQTMRVHLP